MHDLEDVIAPKLLFRYLIDNALSDQAGLSDNELIAFLMTAQGFTDAEIARVLEKTNVGHGRPTMTRSNVNNFKRSALRKVRAVSGLNDGPFSSEEKSAMPRGVYDRSKSKPRRPRNGRAVPTVEVTPPADPPADPVHFWGQPYEISASDVLLDVFCDEAIQAAAAAPADKAVVFPFEDDARASAAAQALRDSQRGSDVVRAFFRRNPPRVIVLRGPNWK